MHNGGSDAPATDRDGDRRTAVGAASIDPASDRLTADPADANAPLADVLRLLGRLPLTDAERADAVRRLLGEHAAERKP